MAHYEAQRDARGFASPYYAAVALGALGRREEALAEIDRIEGAASTTGWLLRVDPHFDPIRDDPRFDAALARIGLGP